MAIYLVGVIENVLLRCRHQNDFFISRALIKSFDYMHVRTP